MTGFKVQTSGVGSICSDNWATTTATAQNMYFLPDDSTYQMWQLYAMAFL